MDALYDLKDLLLKELEGYGKKGEMSAAVLERVDTLAHAAKNLDKVIECCEAESEYSGGSMPRRVYDDGRSMARGRRRDSMGRFNNGYSSREDIADRLRNMMEDAPDERTRQEMQRLASRMEQM